MNKLLIAVMSAAFLAGGVLFAAESEKKTAGKSEVKCACTGEAVCKCDPKKKCKCTEVKCPCTGAAICKCDPKKKCKCTEAAKKKDAAVNQNQNIINRSTGKVLNQQKKRDKQMEKQGLL